MLQEAFIVAFILFYYWPAYT